MKFQVTERFSNGDINELGTFATEPEANLMNKQELGKQIETLRKKFRVTTYELEKKGIHPALPGTIEKGQKGYSIDSLIKYLKAINEDVFLSVGKKEK
jgi:hypothetical protein